MVFSRNSKGNYWQLGLSVSPARQLQWQINSKSINLLILSQLIFCLFELYIFIALAHWCNELTLICRIKAFKTLSEEECSSTLNHKSGMFKAALWVLVTRMTPICEKLWISSLQQAAGVTFQEELSRGLLSATGLDLGVQVLAVRGCSGVSVRGDRGLPCACHGQLHLISDSFKCTAEQPLHKAQPH